MRSAKRALVERPVADEAGVMALTTALAVSAVLFLSGMLAFQVANNNQSNAALRRIQAQSLNAAEGGLSRAYQAIQGAATATQMPCGNGVLSGNLNTSPAKSSYSVSIVYYDTFPVTDNALSCPQGGGAPTSSEAARVISTGITSAGTALATSQYMEALLKVTPGTANGSVFDKALFSNLGFASTNSPTVYGHSGNDANLYTNGDVVCGNSFLVQGSVTAQGSFTGTNSCTVDGNLVTAGTISMANTTTVGGSATSTGSSCLSIPGKQSITMTGNSVVDQSAYAYCKINVSNPATIVHSTVQNDTTLTNPPVEQFPTVPWPDTMAYGATWAAFGYPTQITDNNCAAAGIYQDILNLGTATTGTLIMTSCPITWSGTTVNLNQNLAIFSTGGFTTTNNVTFQSTNATNRSLYLIVPSVVDGNNTQCTNGQPGITFNNNTNFANTVTVLDYTPCTITISNLSTGYGQVYGGQTITPTNNYSSHYVPMTVPTASGGGQSVSTTTIAVVYERQLSSLAAA